MKMRSKMEQKLNSDTGDMTVMTVVCGFVPKSPRAQVSSLLDEINIPNVPLLHCPITLVHPILSFGKNGKECYSVHIFNAEQLNIAQKMCRCPGLCNSVGWVSSDAPKVGSKGICRLSPQ